MKKGNDSSSWSHVDEQPLAPELAHSPLAKTERRDIPGEIRMFRGTTSLSHPIDDIAEAVSSPEARLKWVERMAEDRLIKGSVEEGEWLSYEAYDLIWPVSNRDYVFRQTMTKSSVNDKKRTVINVTSIEHPDYPEKTDRVRGILPTCVFTLNEISKNKTHLEVMVQVDPGGSLPGFVKNLIQKGWSLKTMRAINSYMNQRKL